MMYMQDVNKIEVLKKPYNFPIDWGLKSINVPNAWKKTKGEGVKIAMIDTGADIRHPDIKDKVSSTFNMIDRNYDVTDGLGHGTHVAGLLVGERTGVAPLSELHVVKVLKDDGTGSIGDVMDGINHSINIGADVLNISLGIQYGIPLILKQKIIQAYEAGITIVCAVGNDGIDYPSRYPASMDEVISVGGVDESLSLSNFTNRGYDVLAPSVGVISTYKDNGYAKLSGTSMASPLVAGAIALWISYNRSKGIHLKPYEIINSLDGLIDLNKLIL